MQFSLQDMVRQTLAEADRREKIAQASAEGGKPESSKNGKGPSASRTPADNPSTAPERNYEGVSTEKTSSAFVEKLASATEFLNETFLKEAVGKPEPHPAHMPPTATTGAGIGATALGTNMESPTSGTQSEQAGQATSRNVIPTSPRSDKAHLGNSNPRTSLETTIDSPPGGGESWAKKDVQKQAGVDIDKSEEKALAQKAQDLANRVKKHGDKEIAESGAEKEAALKDILGKVKDVASRAGVGVKDVAGRATAGAKDVAERVGEKAGPAARRAKELVTGSKLKALETNRSLGGAPGLADAISAEKKKVWGTRAGLGAAAVGAGALAASGKKKEAQVQRVLDIMNKMAGESSPANIQAAHHDNPPPASASGEGTPGMPDEASRQAALIASNQAAINYTKQQAKAVPKARMGEVLHEPAQKKSTDPVLHQNLEAAPSAGVKISSVEKLSAARALLTKIAEEGECEGASDEQKERAAKLKRLMNGKHEKTSTADGTMPIGGGF